MLFMNDDKYFRSVKELEQVGCKWWPKEVRDEAMKVSILQYLLDTQEEFISLLTLADNTNPEKLFKLLEASDFEYHLFLKHLMVLTDVGSEPIQRLNSSFKEVFPGKKLEYEISGKKYSYNFTSLPLQGKPTNARMQISTIKNLQKPCKDKKLCKDLIILLIYGASAISLKTRAILYKCKAFEYLGKKDKIMQRVRRNYIPVSYSNEDISNRWPIYVAFLVGIVIAFAAWKLSTQQSAQTVVQPIVSADTVTDTPKEQSKEDKTPVPQTQPIAKKKKTPEEQSGKTDMSNMSSYKLERLALDGDVEAQYQLGKRWVNMHDSINVVKGIQYLKLAASNGSSEARSALQTVYSVLQQSAANGSTTAANILREQR